MKKSRYWTILILIFPLAVFAAVFFCRSEETARPLPSGQDSIAAAERIAELAGEGYEGRQFGSRGGQKASEYIKSVLREQGIESSNGEDYGVGFNATTAVFESAEFAISDIGDGLSGEFEIFKDYNPVADGLGGSIDYFGDVILADGPVEDIPGYMLVGRLVAAKGSGLSEEALGHVLRSGGRGILYFCDNESKRSEMGKKSVDASGKSSETLFIARISGGVYEKLQERAENGSAGIADGVKINVEISFPYLRGENIIGYIPAKKSDECIVFAAGYDGYGSYGEGGHVPGAIDNASGVAGLLELSGKLAQADSAPEKNIVFLFFDGEKSGASGIGKYIEDPIFPLEGTRAVILEKLGWKNSDTTWIWHGSEDPRSERLAEKIAGNFENTEIEALNYESGPHESQKSFQEAGIPVATISSVGVSGFQSIGGSPRDNGGQWDAEKYDENMAGCIEFAFGACFGEAYRGYSDGGAPAFAAVPLALLYLLFAFGVVLRRHPGSSIGKRTIRRISLSRPLILFDRLSIFAISAAFAVALAVFAANVRLWDPGSVRDMFYGMASFIENSGLDGIEELMDGELALSAWIVAISIALAFAGGTAMGKWRGAAGSKGSGGPGISSLAALSIPPVFWGLGLAYVSILIFGDANPGVEFEYSFQALLFPVASTAIVPMVFLSSAVESRVKEEMEKDYVLWARAMGFEKSEIVSRHIARGIFAEAASRIPEMTVMAFSNLIAVEYIFGLPGMMNRLATDIKNPETVFAVLVLTGIMCALSVLLAKGIRALSGERGVS